MMMNHDPLKIRTDELISRLVAEFKYPQFGARRVAENLAMANPIVRAAFLNWWKGGVLNDTLSAAGYTVAQLMREHGMTEIAALLTIDWLLREPDRAIASLRR